MFGNYDVLNNTYSQNNNYIQSVGVLPWIRKQQIIIRAENLLSYSDLHNFFDNVNIDNYVRKTNVIELTNVNGTFSEGDVIGYMSSGSFIPTGRVVSVTPLSTTSVRLYIVFGTRKLTKSTRVTFLIGVVRCKV